MTSTPLTTVGNMHSISQHAKEKLATYKQEVWEDLEAGNGNYTHLHNANQNALSRAFEDIIEPAARILKAINEVIDSCPAETGDRLIDCLNKAGDMLFLLDYILDHPDYARDTMIYITDANKGLPAFLRPITTPLVIQPNLMLADYRLESFLPHGNESHEEKAVRLKEKAPELYTRILQGIHAFEQMQQMLPISHLRNADQSDLLKDIGTVSTMLNGLYQENRLIGCMLHEMEQGQCPKYQSRLDVF